MARQAPSLFVGRERFSRAALFGPGPALGPQLEGGEQQAGYGEHAKQYLVYGNCDFGL